MTEAGAKGIHLGAGSSGFVEMDYGCSDGDMQAEKLHEVDAEGFDVGADSSWRNALKPKARGMRGNLLARNEADLPAVGFAGGTAGAVKVTPVAHDALFHGQFKRIHAQQRIIRSCRMQMQGGHKAAVGGSRDA